MKLSDTQLMILSSASQRTDMPARGFAVVDRGLVVGIVLRIGPLRWGVGGFGRGLGLSVSRCGDNQNAKHSSGQ